MFIKLSSILKSNCVASIENHIFKKKQPIVEFSDFREQTTKTLDASYFARFHYKKITPIKLMTFDGKQVDAQVVKASAKHIHIKCNGECVGLVNISYSTAPFEGANYPEYYKGKPYIHLHDLSSLKNYKGIGTQLIKAAVQESVRIGMEGRVCLTASSTNAKFGSPVPFYYKLGFESTYARKQKLIADAMKNGLPLPKDCESTTMFLPREKAIELLPCKII